MYRESFPSSFLACWNGNNEGTIPILVPSSWYRNRNRSVAPHVPHVPIPCSTTNQYDGLLVKNAKLWRASYSAWCYVHWATAAPAHAMGMVSYCWLMLYAYVCTQLQHGYNEWCNRTLTYSTYPSTSMPTHATVHMYVRTYVYTLPHPNTHLRTVIKPHCH